MILKKHWLIIMGTMIVFLLLTACGKSNESKLMGSWKIVENDDIRSYLEFREGRLIQRSPSEDEPVTTDYILTDTQDDNFIVEIIIPDDGTNMFIFEGHFENKDQIKVIETTDGAAENIELIRVDNIAEEQAKEDKRLNEEKEKAAAKEKAEEEKRLQEEKEDELAVKAERDKQLEVEIEKEKAAATGTKQTIGENGLKQEYLQKADTLENEIITEGKKSSAHDMPPGLYGQYYHTWDDLLQEVWGVLRDDMSSDAFESLKSEQIEWIEMKEQNFAEISDEVASERARGMDYLALETKDRTYYLIENFMD